MTVCDNNIPRYSFVESGNLERWNKYLFNVVDNALTLIYFLHYNVTRQITEPSWTIFRKDGQSVWRGMFWSTLFREWRKNQAFIIEKQTLTWWKRPNILLSMKMHVLRLKFVISGKAGLKRECLNPFLKMRVFCWKPNLLAWKRVF